LKDAFVTPNLGRRPLKTWVFVTSITKFILVLDVLRARNVGVKLKYPVLQLGKEEVPLQCPGVQLHSLPCRKGNSNVSVAWCSRVTAVHLKGPLDLADSITVMGSRATHQAEARMLE
jgi:hypothetical protein